MKKFTILFDDSELGIKSHTNVGIIISYVDEEEMYFNGLWDSSLEKAYARYNKWLRRKLKTQLMGIPDHDFNKMGDMYYEISGKDLKKLIKLEKASGRL